jgi:glycosyltransferase involved in cell wall biosynthesis
MASSPAIDRKNRVPYYLNMTVVHVLQPFASGVITAVVSITEQLPKIKHVVVHGVKLLVDDEARVKAKFPPGVRFIPWKSAGREISPREDLKALAELAGILREFKNGDTVIHLHSSKAGFLGRLACRFLGIKRVVYTPHCGGFVRTDIGPLKRRFFRFLEWFGGRLGGTVVGCGKSEAELYRGLGKRVLWVSNGVSLTPPAKDDNPSLVSFSGVAVLQKNPALFNALALAVGEGDFCWIGDGPLRDRLTAKNITVTGWVDRAALEGLLNRTLVFLSTASWEGLPFGVLEAMNASCALLLKDVPGNRDLVIPGENGRLFGSPREGIEKLSSMLKDREGTLKMGRKSRELAEKFYSVERMGIEYGKIYTSMVG